MKTLLDAMILELEDIASQWNGDDAGIQEDRAHNATDAIDKIKELEELLETLNIKY